MIYVTDLVKGGWETETQRRLMSATGKDCFLLDFFCLFLNRPFIDLFLT